MTVDVATGAQLLCVQDEALPVNISTYPGNETKFGPLARTSYSQPDPPSATPRSRTRRCKFGIMAWGARSSFARDVPSKDLPNTSSQRTPSSVTRTTRDDSADVGDGELALVIATGTGCGTSG